MILGILSNSISCRDSLRITRQDYSGTKLRMDGIFYNEPEKAHFFLYRNGVFFDGGAVFNGSVSELLNFYAQKENYKTAYELPYAWGIVRIENNKIIIAKWVSGDAFGRYTTTRFDGVIINDTTLLLNFPTKTIGADTFYFHKFSHKPDSTNKFIK